MAVATVEHEEAGERLRRRAEPFLTTPVVGVMVISGRFITGPLHGDGCLCVGTPRRRCRTVLDRDAQSMR